MRHPIRILFAATSLTAAGLLGAGCSETVDSSPPKIGQTTPRPTPYAQASASAARANQYRERPEWDRPDAFHSAVVSDQAVRPGTPSNVIMDDGHTTDSYATPDGRTTVGRAQAQQAGQRSYDQSMGGGSTVSDNAGVLVPVGGVSVPAGGGVVTSSNGSAPAGSSIFGGNGSTGGTNSSGAVNSGSTGGTVSSGSGIL